MITDKRMILLSFFLMTACLLPQAKSAVTPSKTQQITSTAIPSHTPTSWEISGAMAARSQNKSWSAAINWLQRGANQYQIRLSGPLGSGTVIINKQGNTVTYRDGPKTFYSRNAAELLRQQTGVRLPVNSLYYWVRGVPAPGAVQSAKRDSANHLAVLRQSGYTIQYAQYMSVGKTTLPSHIRLQGNGVAIKLVIKRWRV